MRKSFFIAIAAVALAGAAAVLFSTAEKPEDYFAQSLRAAHITEQVEAGGIPYDIAGGAVSTRGTAVTGEEALAPLRLAYAKALAERAPALALAGTDPQALLSAVEDLERIRENLAAVQEGERDAQSIRDSLYPLSFLRAAAELEKRRLRFIEEGTEENYRRYLEAEDAALGAYRADLERFTAAFTEAVPENIRIYNTAGVTITRDDLMRALQFARRGIEETRDTVKNRRLCAEGSIHRCTADSLVLASPPRTVAKERDDPTALAGDVVSIMKKAGRVYAEGPLIELDTSVCTGALPPVFATEIKKSAAGTSYQLPSFVGDLRLIRTDTYPTFEFYRYFTERGVTFVPDYPFSHYKCPHILRDFSPVLWTQSVRRFALQTPLSEVPGAPERAQQLEAALAGGTLITQRDAAEYMALAYGLANSGALAGADSRAVISLILQQKNHSAGFDRSVEEIASTEEKNFSALEAGVPLITEPYFLFYIRSGFFVLFMLDNPSVLGAHELFFSPYASDTKTPYVLYSAMQDAGTKKLLEKNLRDYTALHLE